MHALSSQFEWLVPIVGPQPALATWVAIGVATLAIALLLTIVARRLLLALAHAIAERTSTTWDDVLLENRVIHRLSYALIPLLMHAEAPLLLSPRWAGTLRAGCMLALIAVIVAAVDGLLRSGEQIYGRLELVRAKPIRFYVQVAQLVVWVVGAILFASTILDKSPWTLLGGLGALSAIFLLLFRDSLLGFVASVQLTANDLVRIGDWIEVPSHGADGDVLDVTLQAVRVRNFDLSIVAIPTYRLMSEGFKNWRGMHESGGRRIKRAVSIDMTSIRVVDDALLARLEQVELLRGYLARERPATSTQTHAAEVGQAALLNGRQLTNAGALRAYVAAYLRAHPSINQEMTLVVRQLAPGASGLPLEICAFTLGNSWPEYEAIQADIFDHILAAVPHFDLRLLQK